MGKQIINFVLMMAMMIGIIRHQQLFAKNPLDDNCVNVEDSLVTAYKKGAFKISDDVQTSTLLERLVDYKTLCQRAQYFEIFNSILSISDGALAEVLGEYCIKWLLKDSPYVLAYLRKNPEVEDQYTVFMAYEFLYEEDAFIRFRKQVLDQFVNVPLSYPIEFLDKLRDNIKSLQE